MVDRVEKFLRKIPKKQYRIIISIIERILNGDINNLDVKQLSGYRNVFRVRKGKIRIVFKRQENGEYNILYIEYRSEGTYKF
jgi:mRNA-degrading endonuclease RelE of RelBE toxin-antitoxin system